MPLAVPGHAVASAVHTLALLALLGSRKEKKQSERVDEAKAWALKERSGSYSRSAMHSDASSSRSQQLVLGGSEGGGEPRCESVRQHV